MIENQPNLDSQSTPVDPALLRAAMRQWVTGVTIVSSCWRAEQHGMTVSSFTSISLDPPLVCISLAGETRTYRLLEASGIFGVTILNENQQEISDRFAGRVADTQDRFAGLDTFTLNTGAPFLAGGLVWFDCEVLDKLKAGNNTVIIGKVIAVKQGSNGQPLLYYDRDYHNICD